LAAAPSFCLAEKVLSVCDDVNEPQSLNPYQVFSEKAHTLIQQMLEGLLRFKPDGRLEPCLAERWERVNDTTTRFFLRKGVVFHNGEPFDAQSVKFSIEKYVNPATRFLGAGFVETISSVNVVNDHVVDIVTRGPDGLLLNRLAAWVHIVPARYYAKVGDEGFAAHPVGTGPFQFESWERGRAVAMRANPKYWIPSLPNVDKLVFKFIPTQDQVASLLSGDVDILTMLPGTRTLEVQKNAGTRVIKRPAFYTVVGNFVLDRPPLSAKKVREALNIGLDRKALVRYDIFGNGIPIGTISLPGEFGHLESIEPYPYNPRKARQLLSEAGYPSGLALKALVKVNAERSARIIAKQWEQIGIKLQFKLFTDAEIPDYFRPEHERDWDMMISDCPDPMNHAFFIRSIYLDSHSPFSFYALPEVDQRLRRLVATIDPAAQRAVSEELDQHIHDEYLVLPTYQRLRTYGLRRGIDFMPYSSGMSYFYEATFSDAKTSGG
jgi:peptide/nickel transport system substrate-binding protein